jgi:hypothetical protein
MALKLSSTNESDVTAEHWRVTRVTFMLGHKEHIGNDPEGNPIFGRRNRIEVVVQLWKSQAAYNNMKRHIDGAERTYSWAEPDNPVGNNRIGNVISDIETKLLTLPEFAGAVIE